MKRGNNFTGIGRMYQGSQFLAEVLYHLKSSQDNSNLSDSIKGHILVLAGTRVHTFSAPKTLRLEDGRTLQITLEHGDTIVGKYSIHGIGCIE